MPATAISNGFTVTSGDRYHCTCGPSVLPAASKSPAQATKISYQRRWKASRRSEVVRRRVRRVEIRMATAIATSSNDEKNDVTLRGPETEPRAFNKKCRV